MFEHDLAYYSRMPGLERAEKKERTKERNGFCIQTQLKSIETTGERECVCVRAKKRKKKKKSSRIFLHKFLFQEP